MLNSLWKRNFDWRFCLLKQGDNNAYRRSNRKTDRSLGNDCWSDRRLEDHQKNRRKNKALDKVFRKEILASHFNRFKLGWALNDCHGDRCGILFAERNMSVCQQGGIDTQFNGINITNFCLCNTPTICHHTWIFHRPDLEQNVLEFILHTWMSKRKRGVRQAIWKTTLSRIELQKRCDKSTWDIWKEKGFSSPYQTRSQRTREIPQ